MEFRVMLLSFVSVVIIISFIIIFGTNFIKKEEMIVRLCKYLIAPLYAVLITTLLTA